MLSSHIYLSSHLILGIKYSRPVSMARRNPDSSILMQTPVLFFPFNSWFVALCDHLDLAVFILRGPFTQDLFLHWKVWDEGSGIWKNGMHFYKVQFKVHSRQIRIFDVSNSVPSWTFKPIADHPDFSMKHHLT